MQAHESVLIPVPALFSFSECLWFLNRNYDDCLHIIHQDSIAKVIAIGDQLVLFSIRQQGSFLNVTILVGTIDREEKEYLIRYILDWFDMDRNIQPFYDLLAQDDRLAYMAESFRGLRLLAIENLFEAICWCIIGQQINLSFAYKVKRRLVEKYGRSIEFNNEVFYIFPDAHVLASVRVEDLRSMQFSDRKAEYTIGVAKAFVEGTLSKEILNALPDLEAKKKALTAKKGIGVWTANYALMKSLKAHECIPHGDIGLLHALSNHSIIQNRNETDKIDSLFSQFKGWESYLVFYLWRSLTFQESLLKQG